MFSFTPLYGRNALRFVIAFALSSSIASSAVAAGRICTSADTLLFGNRAVGTTTTSAATVTNCGDTPWSFTDVSIDPATGPAFRVRTTCVSPMTLEPGASCALAVSFVPMSPGQTSGALWLHNSTTTPDQLVTFYGRGIDAQSGSATLSFVPPVAEFGTQRVLSQSPPLQVELHNQGPAPLTLSALVLNGPTPYDFQGLSSDCRVGATIAAGDFCTLTLFFRPLGAGARRASLVVDSPQLAALASMSISGTAQSAPLANYTGLFWNAPAGSESGWGINVAHQGDVIFATWFTYDAKGNGVWLSMSADKKDEGIYAGALVQTGGPPFSASPWSPAQVTTATVGSGTLAFSDIDNGTFSYTLNGVVQTKAITRQIFGTTPTCSFDASSDPVLATNYQGLWWAAPPGAESGWGINFTHQGDTIFATWFTYGADHLPLWLSVTARKTGAMTYAGTLYRSRGPSFDAIPFDPAKVVLTQAGTATFTFSNGNTAAFDYMLDGIAGHESITREIFQSPGTLCR